ncbi:zinc finger protein with KRAB and SCAN domains 4 isoform X2 [Brienomyrus brachyistius]|uniref:zinc finger protein with KRAB and SCAN domains 4 isoform X2 n=1 Tax=Brienomyrus brachyistius TaxID=42636 RepID=UPI0020B304F8|nr:zinc finger protein with KRAB and SCAN domains 4 isoform X2 [Brienomyrus brachyistius]
MSEAILAFQAQLSGVMETVFKAAMYEIVRLVEDSFLEEVSRSREQVETLKKRLQWSESKRKEREIFGRARCAECGRAGAEADVGQTEDRSPGPAHGVTENRGLKQEGAQEIKWAGCPREDVEPLTKVLDEEVAPGTDKSPEAAALLSSRRDPALKEELPDKTLCLRTASCGFHDDSIHGGCCEQEWMSSEGGGTQPSAAEQQGNVQAPLEGVSVKFGQAAATLHCARGSHHGDQMLSGVSEGGGLQAEPQLHAESLPPLRAVKMQNELKGHVPIKHEEQTQCDCTTEPRPCVLHALEEQQHKEGRAEENMHTVLAPHGPLVQHGHPGDSSAAEEPPGQVRKQLQGSAVFLVSGNVEARRQANTVQGQLGSTPPEKCFTPMINKAQLKAQSGRSPHSCIQCGKSFSHTCHLRAHMQTHTGERPFICSMCGRSFTKLSNLKAHRRVHTDWHWV